MTPVFGQYQFAPEHLPAREIGINVSGWAMQGWQTGASATGLYTRKLVPALAIEAGADAGGAGGRPFAHTFVQLRFMRLIPSEPGAFFTVGLGRGFADRDHPIAPRGRGWLFGMGFRTPVNIANRMALRFEVQGGEYAENRSVMRVILGFAASLD